MLQRDMSRISIFCRNFFCLIVLNNFVGEPFSVSLISGIEKLHASEDYVIIFDFLSKFLSHSAEIIRR